MPKLTEQQIEEVTTSRLVAEMPIGYYTDPVTGGWCTLPWPGDQTLPYEHPDRLALLPPSIGPQVIAWIQTWLISHKTGEPFMLTGWQKRFIHMAYAVKPDGSWLYDNLVMRRAKGMGKDPLLAALAIAEFVGPVRFAGFLEDGTPVGRPHRMSKVEIGANAIKQASEALEIATQMLSKRLKAAARIETGMTRFITPTGSRLQIMTTAVASNEGTPDTAVFMNETHHMTVANKGQGLYDVASRNVEKSSEGARIWEFTNAHESGIESVAEQTFTEWQRQLALVKEGTLAAPTILYDSQESDPRIELTNPEAVKKALMQATYGSPWIDLEKRFRAAIDARKSLATVIRFYFNGLATAEEAWCDPQAFDACAHPEKVVQEGDRIALFLDCSKSGDATGLVGCRLSDGHIFTIMAWWKPKGPRGETWLVPREQVDAVVRQTMAYYKVIWFGVDPSPAQDDETEAIYWREVIDAWHRDYARKLQVWANPGVHSCLYDMRLSTKGSVERNRLFTEEAMTTVQAIEQDKTLTHDGDPTLRLHVFNARRRPNRWGVGLGKVNRSSDKLVDLAVCMVGARLGRTLALRNTKVRTSKTRGARLLN